MNRLTCNLRNIKRPIRGVIPNKKIVRDELGVEIPLPIYTRIKKDCNVYAVIDGEEHIIPTEADFKKFLLKADNPAKEIVYEAPNGMTIPNTLSKDENNNYIDTGKTVEACAYGNHPVETENTEKPEVVITTASMDMEIQEETSIESEEVAEEESVEENNITDNKPQNNNRNRKNKNRR